MEWYIVNEPPVEGLYHVIDSFSREQHEVRWPVPQLTIAVVIAHNEFCPACLAGLQPWEGEYLEGSDEAC